MNDHFPSTPTNKDETGAMNRPRSLYSVPMYHARKISAFSPVGPFMCAEKAEGIITTEACLCSSSYGTSMVGIGGAFGGVGLTAPATVRLIPGATMRVLPGVIPAARVAPGATPPANVADTDPA